MREKIFGILYELIFADNLATTWKIECHKASTNIDSLVNQEVEKRIAERLDGFDIVYDFGEAFKHQHLKTQQTKWQGVLWMLDWYRSRLTNPGDSQKTEGGGE